MPPHFRFNWNSPLTMSPSNPRTLYFGGNHVFKSVDRGDTWRIISPDLTTNNPQLRNPSKSGGLTVEVTGGENHFTVFDVRESPLDAALVWAGTDDGNVQITRNGGASWTNVRGNLPGVTGEVWVSRVEPSHHEVGTAYVVLDNHRLDDMNPHVFVTRDFGATFADITGNLPDGIGSYVINEDPVNPNLLFVGTEYGVYASVEGGRTWFKLSSGMPNVAIRDLVIHPRDGDLIAGTHGRAIWILDDLTPLRQATPAVTAKAAHLFDNEVATRWVTINLGRKQEDFLFRGANPPAGASINFWLNAAPQGAVALEVLEFVGDRVAAVRLGEPRAGINRVYWDLQFPSTAAQRSAMQARLDAALTFLDTRVVDADKRQQLGQLRTALAAASTDQALNQVRSTLVADFNGYAAGRPLFGSPIGRTAAEAGTYRLTLRVNGQTLQGTVTVRDDPMMAEHGGR
jgi:hypothetical protein